MKLFAILALILIAGCTTQVETSSPVQPTPNQPEKINTSGLGFVRNADDVFNTNTPVFQKPIFTFPKLSDGKLVVYYFYSPNCVASKAITPEIDRLEGIYKDVKFVRYDLTTQNGTWAYLAFADDYNLSKEMRLVPQVLLNGTVITDRFNINESLESMIQADSG